MNTVKHTAVFRPFSGTKFSGSFSERTDHRSLRAERRRTDSRPSLEIGKWALGQSTTQPVPTVPLVIGLGPSHGPGMLTLHNRSSKSVLQLHK